MRSGFAALIGRPNVGKSTLLNRLLGEKIAIVSPKPQTTRTRILGVVTQEAGQIAFVDTPGIHQAKGALNRFMVDVALNSARECDVVLFMIDTDGLFEDVTPTVSPGNRAVLEKLKHLGKPTLLVINKIDAAKKHLLLPLIDLYRQEFSFAEVVPISARHGDGIEEFFGTVLQHMPESDELMFPADMMTDQAEKVLVGEYVREQVLRACRDEVPYSTAVVVEYFDESEREPLGRATPQKSTQKKPKKGQPKPQKPDHRPLLMLAGLVRIHASVYVERDSQKAIIIGKRGEMLKTIGSEARRSIERLLGTHVFLSLQVKVEPRWSERADALLKMGYQQSKD
jgi:GTP-binding protein Era